MQHQHVLKLIGALISVAPIQSVSVQAQCPLGSFFTLSGCQLCSPGTFSASINATSCKPCPSGTFFNQTGESTESACQFYPTGTVSNSLGARSCKLCPPGNNSSHLGTTRDSCSPGTFIDVPTLPDGTVAPPRACTPCFRGSYQNLPNQFSCRSYPNSVKTTKSRRGATSAAECKTCPTWMKSESGT